MSESISESVSESISESASEPSSESQTPNKRVLPNTGENNSGAWSLAGAGLLLGAFYKRRKKGTTEQEETVRGNDL
ncbi:TPA: LPXTG cell wall anchor domain-containing protein [Streptococcus suis]